MKPEEWAQVDDLLQQALSQVPGERTSFVDRACGDNESLRQEVQSLLEHHEQAGSFLEQPPAEIAAEFVMSESSGFVSGQSISHYTITEFLGAGGMGEVYLAQDPRLNRRVAIKVLQRPFVSDDERVRRFEQEARAASVLNHPNIVTIHEVGKAGDAQFMVAEFIDGETLSQRLARIGRMNIGEALDVALQVANALEAAHAAGIVHRDVKPDNIMVRPDGLVKVLDFGLVKLSEPANFVAGREGSDNPGMKTNPGLLMGTALYMSPEQARGQPVDARADIWSLGVVLFEMFAGTSPFDGPTPSHVIVRILDEAVPPLTAYVKEMPPALERIVGKSLRKNPDERYQTTKDFADDLKSLRVQLEERGGVTLSVPASREKRSGWFGFIVTVASVVFVVGVLPYDATRHTQGDVRRKETAYRFYTSGRSSLRDGAQGAWNCREYLLKATAMDPNPPAYAGLSDCYSRLGILGEMAGSKAWPEAKEAAVKALALDPYFGPAHRSIAAVRIWYDRDWENTLQALDKARELAADNTDAYASYLSARVFRAMGQFDNAIRAWEKVQESDLNVPERSSEYLGRLYFQARHYELAIEECEKYIGRNPDARICLAEAYVQQGRFDEALSEAWKVRFSADKRSLIRLGGVFAASGDIKEAKEILRFAERFTLTRPDLEYFIAIIYAALRDNDNAILWLTRAFDEFSDCVIDLKLDPRFDTLRTDPRFTTLLSRLNLPHNEPTGVIAGSVNGPNGTAIPGAEVIAVDLRTSYRRHRVKTSAEGNYAFLSLPPGFYNMEFTAPGFSPTLLNDVEVSNAKETPLNIQLEVAAVAAGPVTVVALPGGAKSRRVVDSKTVSALPAKQFVHE